MNSNVIYGVNKKWSPLPFISQLRRFQTITAECNSETTNDYVYKLKQITKR